MREYLERIANDQNYTKQILEIEFENYPESFDFQDGKSWDEKDEVEKEEAESLFYSALRDADIPENWDQLINKRAEDIEAEIEFDNEEDFERFSDTHELLTSTIDEDEDSSKLDISNDKLIVVKYTTMSGMTYCNQAGSSAYETEIYIFKK